MGNHKKHSLSNYAITLLNWFMVDSKLMKKYLVWIDRIKAEVNNTIDFETFQIKHSVYMRCANGFTDWRWIYGQIVT